jgi:hypothetical protein
MKHYVQKQEEWIIRIALLLYVAGNLICAFGCSGRQSPYFISHHRKASAMFSGPCGFNSGIDGQ